jgi:hypothetical protein
MNSRSKKKLPAKLWHINKAVSHVPDKSLCKDPAALMPASL